ncbi:MAG: DUF2279 domain-containing protein [Candidatus Kapabacteria bacterium]|nr:DUF2279 domain-containing protein [Candidatus Kapabacteria bacterium]
MTKFTFLIFLCSQLLFAGTDSTSSVNYYAVGGITIATGVWFGISQSKQVDQYWHDPAPFHFNFKDDWKYAHGADKFGHAFFANTVATVYTEALKLSGVDSVTSAWYAGGIALTHQTIIEIRDGLSTGKNGAYEPYLGFSWGDMTANTIGASLPILQVYYPFTQNFRYKISYNGSAKYKSGEYYSKISDDYESTYHWLSFNAYTVLPKHLQSYWTPFLNIAVGHSVKDIVDRPANYWGNGYHELWLSLDYNFEALPGDAAWMRSIKKLLNIYKLPAPCIRVLPSVVWYGFRI